MGWIGTFDYVEEDKGKCNRKATLDSNYSGELCGITKSTMVGSVYYAAAWYITDEGERKDYGLICLTSYKEGEFFYKDMDEGMIPNVRTCPKFILDLLDEVAPLDSGSDYDKRARTYRDVCREMLRVRELPTAFRKVKVGDSIVWNIPAEASFTCCGKSIAGSRVRLTKLPRNRNWWCPDLYANVPTKYVNPADCELVEQ